METYIPLGELEVYKLSRKLSRMAWEVYKSLEWEIKRGMGFQFIDSVDSIGANIAESYGRFHYLDRIKFLYNSRGSLIECNNHWLELLFERELITKEKHDNFKKTSVELLLKLNNYISSLRKSKEKDQ